MVAWLDTEWWPTLADEGDTMYIPNGIFALEISGIGAGPTHSRNSDPLTGQ